MGLKFCSIASGSSGNSIFVASDTTKIIVDVGISTTRIEKALDALGEKKENLNVLLTHAHSDHIKDLPVFSKRHDPMVYTSFKSADKVGEKIKNPKKLIEFGEGDFFIGDITVSPFEVSHDVPCFGYCFSYRGKRIALCTDLGTISSKIVKYITGSDLIFIESNHDPKILAANQKYNDYLKRRILSTKGHLSNETAAEAILNMATSGASQFILAHLSKENNYPELAYRETANRLEKAGAVVGKDVNLEVASPDRLTAYYDII